MPTYVYACTSPDCGHQFEAVQAFTDDALSVCPACGHRVRKVFGSVGVVFKGSGFYRNDSREKSTSGAAEGGRDGEKSGGSSEQSASGTAPADAGKPASGKPETTSSAKTEGSPPAPAPAKSASPTSGPGSGSPKAARTA